MCIFAFLRRAKREHHPSATRILLLTLEPITACVLLLAHSSAVTCCKRKAILGVACFSDIM